MTQTKVLIDPNMVLFLDIFIAFFLKIYQDTILSQWVFDNLSRQVYSMAILDACYNCSEIDIQGTENDFSYIFLGGFPG